MTQRALRPLLNQPNLFYYYYFMKAEHFKKYKSQRTALSDVNRPELPFYFNIFTLNTNEGNWN